MEDNSPTANPIPVPEAQVTATAAKSFSKFTLWGIVAALVAIILLLVGYLLLNRPTADETTIVPVTQTSPQPQTGALVTATPSPSPEVSRVTTSNADATLGETDAGIQQTVNQVTMDLNNLDKINLSLDNSAGL